MAVLCVGVVIATPLESAVHFFIAFRPTDWQPPRLRHTRDSPGSSHRRLSSHGIHHRTRQKGSRFLPRSPDRGGLSPFLLPPGSGIVLSAQARGNWMGRGDSIVQFNGLPQVAIAVGTVYNNVENKNNYTHGASRSLSPWQDTRGACGAPLRDAGAFARMHSHG